MSLRNKINGLKEVWQFENRWHLICSRLFFAAEPINIYRYRGMEILVDHAAGDANGAREVLTSAMYRQFLEPLKFDRPVNVLDLGANNGGFPLLLHALGIAIGKLACVELNPKTFSRLRFNIERNLQCEFFGLNAGVCGENRTLEVDLGAGSVGDSIYAPAGANGTSASKGVESYRLPGRTLDDIYDEVFGSEKVDICKMDIEAAEYEIFASPYHQSLARCRYLIMEIHDRPGQDPSKIIAELSRLGFTEIKGTVQVIDAVRCFVNSG